MSTEAIGAEAPEATNIAMDVDQPPGLHSPPDSNDAMNLDGSDSELSDLDELADKLNDNLPCPGEPDPPMVVEAEAEPEVVKEEEEDIGEILPDHYSGTVPIFKPTMKQFKDFKRFMEKVDRYGMKSGIIKIIPPNEWKNSLPDLDDLVKPIRVREPIKQDIMGSNGTYRQVNILHQRSYNLPQWKQLCDQSEHQPPARRGERRANAEKHRPTRTKAPAAPKEVRQPAKKKRGRVTRGRAAKAKEEDSDADDPLMTPVSPPPELEKAVESIEQDPGVKEEGECEDEDDMPVIRRMGGFSRQSKPKTQSTSARRKYIRREGSAMIDEKAFRDWDYRMDVSDYTPERCEELERTYWKTLTYAPPLYGADLPGTLFDESTDLWNLNKLPNLLDVLGTKVPGVNTAYLYLGMWKATFAWHLEDVDLYSINYLHFGAPKQWYSISQADARRFETAMKTIWPTEAKACDQFLRHKAFLISPAHLKQHYNITVNKCVSYPGEFVVTYPYGYHSGYNLGYNCAEAVNFALDSWLPLAKIAKKCQCAEAQDSVWVDVYEIERKLRGESTEYEETEEEEEEEEEDDDQETSLPSPRSTHGVRIKGAGRKRKRASGKEPKVKAKKLRLRLKSHAEPPCCLCPNDIPGAEIMSTDDGRKAHRLCALYMPETFIESVDDVEIIANVNRIDKARLELKCLYCRSKKGACFQCSEKKCPRSYHATCAAAAGVFVEDGEVPVIGEDGTEYKDQEFQFRCRFHRTKRDRKFDGDALEETPEIRRAAAALKKDDICQLQYFRGDIFAGVVVENRQDEETLLLDIIPNGGRVEVQWKWLLLPDPADFRLPKASANAIPMPTSRKAKQEINAKRPVDEIPRKGDEFGPNLIWAEFHTNDTVKNSAQVKVDFTKDNTQWHYMGETSTEAKAQYTEDPSKPQHNPKANFLDSIPKPVSAVPLPPQLRRSYSATHAPPAFGAGVPLAAGPGGSKQAKPYIYKPRKPIEPGFGTPYTSQTFVPKTPGAPTLLPHPQTQLRQQMQHPSFPQPMHVQHQQPHHFQQQRGSAPTQGLAQGQKQDSKQQHAQSTFQFKQYQPPAEGGQEKDTWIVYSPDRRAPFGGSTGIPQLPGLTWPPAHMKSGQNSQPHSRVWSPSTEAATPRPYPTPMTSSSLKPSSVGHPPAVTAGSQPQPSAYQKYSFFQVHHNRDASRYRTPYAPWGGFMNGYEGDLRAFLIKAQHALSGKESTMDDIPVSAPPLQQPRTNILPLPVSSSTTGYSSPYSQPSHANRPTSPSPFTARHLGAASAPIPVSSLSAQHLASSTPLWDARQPGSAPLHHAIRPQYGGPVQQSWAANPRSTNVTPQRQVPPAVKAPAFHKQSHSPIPLPSYVKQMTASAANAPKSSPLSRPPQQAGSGTTNPKPAAKQLMAPSVRQPPLQKAPPTNPTPVQQRVDVQPTNPFAHPQNAPVNNYPVQVPMHHHHVPQSSWAPPTSPAHYDGNQGAPQSVPSRMMPPPSASTMHQEHNQQHVQQHVQEHNQQHNQQHAQRHDQQHNQQHLQQYSQQHLQQYNQQQHPPMLDVYNHYMPPPTHVEQQHHMHHMHEVNVPSPTENYYPPPPLSDFSYPPPPPELAPGASGYPMIPASEDSQALLEKMMMNLKKATGQLGTTPT